jgi:signal transduction histidine kinase
MLEYSSPRSLRRKLSLTFIFGAVALIINLIFMLPSLYAQRILTTEAGATIRAFSAEDGIPGANFSNAIVTEDGFIWLSTTSGIVRMSGSEIEDFGPEYGIPLMRQLHYDRKNNTLWFTDAETLIRYDHQQIVSYTAADGFVMPGGARKEAIAMLADSQNRLWIGSLTPPLATAHNGGLVLFGNGEFKTFSKEIFPLHNVTGIFETSDGSVWFTSSGHNTDGYNNNYAWLARYKDNSFQVFDTLCPCMNVNLNFQEPHGLSPAIVEDRHGNLWFHCYGRTSTTDWSHEKHGLFVFRDGSFEPVHEINEHLKNGIRVFEIYYDEKDDELYVALTRNEGFPISQVHEVVWVKRDGEWQHEPITKPEELKELLAKDYNTDLLMPIQFFLNRLSDGRLKASFLIVDLPTNRWFSVVFVKEGNEWKWMDTLPGIIFMNPEGNVYFTAQQEPDNVGIYISPYSRLLTQADGLTKLPTDGGQLFTDADGNVWITYGNRWDAATKTWNSAGLNMWDGERLHSFTTENGLTTNTVFEPVQSTDDSLWFPSDNGVNRFTKEDGIYRIDKKFTQSGEPFRVSDALKRTNGEMYFYQSFVTPKTDEHPGYSSFFGRFDGQYIEPFEPPFPDSLTKLPYQAFDMITDRDNRLWILARFAFTDNELGSATTRIRVLEDGSWFEPSAEWQVPDTRLFYVGELKNGKYYVTNGGFYKFDFDRKQFIDLSDSIAPGSDFRILQQVITWNMRFDIQGKEHLYIRLRERGLVVFDEAILTYLDRRNGLPSLQLLYPNIDRNGDVLFTVPNGGVIFNGKEFMHIRDNAVKDGSPRAIARDKYQNMLILYQGLGVTVTKLDTMQYPVRLSSVWVDGQRYFEGQSVKFASNQNNIEFRFATLNFTNHESVQFTYLLEGFDQDWSRPTKINFMEYRNLPAGNYTFRLKGISQGNIFSEEAVFHFTIAPPWWQTTVAYIGYIILLVIIGYFANRFLRERAIAKERERAREKELAQAREIEKAYTELKATQEQLIQSEKMASLGELTAGIAHEIQNPLNFVNNFAEVSGEMIEELNEELEEGSRQYAVGSMRSGEAKLKVVEEIANDIKQNLEKIHHHGKRADAIVKGMLQHSRTNSGHKELTDINALADEYLRLSYHGLRAKDKTFNASFETDFDPNLPKVKVVPQDIGRVLLNLINNAFYACAEHGRSAVSEKTPTGSRTPSGLGIETPTGSKTPSGSDYKPTVTVSTNYIGDKIEISVKDNGPGIPEEIKNKIFQPFFTTKPTGQGTGLGLSLSYDIVKAHGGILEVESKPGETVFTIKLDLAQALVN